MDVPLQSYVLSLAREYLDLIEMMTSGAYEGAEYRALDSERTSVHNDLIRLLGAEFARPFDMQAHARALIQASSLPAPHA